MLTRLNELLHWILEARQDMFLAMYNALFAVSDDDVRDEATEEVLEAMGKLGRNDRVLWYVRWRRLYWAREAAETSPEAEPLYQRYLREWSKRSGEDPYVLERLLLQFDERRDHFEIEGEYLLEALAQMVGFGIHEFNQLQFAWQSPREIVEFGIKVYFKWIEGGKREIPDKKVRREQKAKDLIVFPDGWRWMLLDVGSCSLEAQSMSHCGNKQFEQPGDRLLSLREPLQRDETLLWRPHLTFVLHANGMLGEMKGYANSQPKVEYHPYILELLRNPIVKGLEGSTHEPWNDFHLEHLTDEDREDLLADRPDLVVTQT